MAKKDANAVALQLIKLLGGPDNLLSYTNCMTRFRANVKDVQKVQMEELKQASFSLGVVNASGQIQVVLGPGFVRKVSEEIQKIYPQIPQSETIGEDFENDNSADLKDVAATVKAQQKEKNNSSVQQFLSKFAKIFTPLIYGFIGAGILAGVGGILQSAYTDSSGIWTNEIAQSWSSVFNVLLNLWKDAFIIIVGWRTAEVFGGTGVVGAIGATMFVPHFAALYTAPFIAQGTDGFTFLGITINDPMTNWLTIGFRPSETLDAAGSLVGYSLSYASGAIFGAMMVAFISIPIERKIREYVPEVVDMVLSSTLTFIAILFLSYFLIIPLSGIIFNIVAWLFSTLST